MIHQTLEDGFDPELISNEAGRLDVRNVHLWVVNRVECQGNNYSAYFLNEEEKNRAEKFRFSRDRDLFVLGRYISRILLAHYADSTPDKVEIVTDEFGKPHTDQRLNFNISHSHDQLLLGFSDSALGVDIEQKNSTTDMERLAESHFSESEFLSVMNEEKDKRRDRFFEIWTKKESLIKGVGKGFSLSLQDFDVTGRHGKVDWDFESGQTYGDWYVRECEVGPGYKSAYATRYSKVSLNIYRLASGKSI